MKISEGIVLGGQGVKPLRGHWFEFVQEPGKPTEIIAACPLGCLYVAAIGSRVYGQDVLEQLMSRWPELDTVVKHPMGHTEGRLLDMITTATDVWGYTREQVVDWLIEEGY